VAAGYSVLKDMVCNPVKTMSRDGPTLCSISISSPCRARPFTKIQKAPRSRNLESAPHGKRHAHAASRCSHRPWISFQHASSMLLPSKVVTKSNTGVHPEHYLALDDVSLYHRLLRSSTQAHQPQCADSNGWAWSVRRQRRSCLRDVIDITYIARLPP
jgi:hypothetical protein